MPLLGPLRQGLSRTGMQWAALALALGILGLLSALDFYASFRHHRTQAFADLNAQAARVESRVEHQLETIYFALGNLQVVLADSGGAFRRGDLQQRLAGIQDSLHGVRTLLVLDTDGTVTAASREELVGGNFAYRDYFSVPRAQPDPRRLYVPPPFRTVLDVLSLTVSRAIVSRDGKFVGVICATLDPEFFAELLQTSRTTDDMYILLSQGDPTAIFASAPAAAPGWLRDLAGQNGIADASLDEQETAGAALPVVEVRGEKRAVAAHWAQTKQMTEKSRIRVLVSRELTALEQGGYHDFAFKIGLYVGIVGLSAFCLGWFQRRQRQHRQERDRHAQIVRDRERFIRTLADNFPGLLAYWTPDLRCAYASHAHQEWFGWRPEEMVGMRLEDAAGADSFRMVETHVRAALNGEAQRFECTLTKTDGSCHQTWVQYIPDHDGETVCGFMVLVTDISEVKQGQLALQDAHRELLRESAGRSLVENTLRAREAVYRALLDNMLNGFTACRMRYDEGRAQDFIFLETNPAFSVLTGLHSVVGKWLSDVLPEIRDSDPKIFEVFERVAQTGQPERLETFVSAIGRWLSLSVCSPCRGDFFAIFDDISERKQAENELVQLNTDLATRTRQAEAANEAKTRFLSSVSHELRTPLHTILGYSRLLLKEADGETKRQLEVVERSGTQLLKLIDDLLEFNLSTAEEAGELQADVLVLSVFFRLLEQTGRLLAEPADNHFRIDLADDLPTAVWVDERRLLQVLHNLLGNACKYTRNGNVTLRVTRDDEAAGTAAAQSCRLCFSVEDSGAGIARESMESIFEAFNRGAAHHRQPGLGLGLAISRQWVRTMGGDIVVHSELGLGSRFSFTLELPTATAEQHVPAFGCEAFREVLARTPRTVLVVDDNAANRLLLFYLCKHWGFRTVEAGDGDAALELCRTATPPIDAVLVDQFMPVADGWEFLCRLRQTPALAQLPTALVSASAAQKPKDFPPEIDFDLVLLKPIDAQALACFLCRHLRLVESTSADCPNPPPTGETLADPVLPAAELTRFREMLNLGRVLAIEQWAQDLAAGGPAHTAFAERVVMYCRAGNLAALERMAAVKIKTR